MDAMLKHKILDRIKPTLEEHESLEKTVKKFCRKLKKSAKNLEISCDFFVGGSFGKGTYLKGTFDVDVFCRFDLKYSTDKLSNFLEAILNNAKLKSKKQKGSRDYFSVLYGRRGKKIYFEVIPNRKIKELSDASNSTDVSPLHVEFLKEQIQRNPNLSDEIRLAKQFFKANNFYGAESYINGFSGHVIDILVSYYGNFENLINAAKRWKEHVCIDIKGFYEDDNEIMSNIEKDKLSNLIVVDPIIKSRNASRALSNEKYSEFVLLVNNLDEIVEDHFVVSKPNANIIIEDVKNFARENNLRFLIYKFRIKMTDESEDIVGAKMLKMHGKTKKYFSSYDFKVFKDDFFIDISNNVCLFILLFEKVSLPTIKKIEGPKVYMKEAVQNFLEKKDRYFIEDGRVCVYEKRVVMKFKDVAKITALDFERLLGRDISFVKRVRIIR